MKTQNKLDYGTDTNSAKGENLNIEQIIENEEVDLDDIIERKSQKENSQLPSSDLLENPLEFLIVLVEMNW